VGSYKVHLKESAVKELTALPRKDRERAVARIHGLSKEPRPTGCEKLAGYDDRYRVRQGRYRIVYSIEDRDLVVWVVKIGHRKDVYR
jgi:mRNA interferase RelE/StbE